MGKAGNRGGCGKEAIPVAGAAPLSLVDWRGAVHACAGALQARRVSFCPRAPLAALPASQLQGCGRVGRLVQVLWCKTWDRSSGRAELPWLQLEALEHPSADCCLLWL